ADQLKHEADQLKHEADQLKHGADQLKQEVDRRSQETDKLNQDLHARKRESDEIKQELDKLKQERAQVLAENTNLLAFTAAARAAAEVNESTDHISISAADHVPIAWDEFAEVCRSYTKLHSTTARAQLSRRVLERATTNSVATSVGAPADEAVRN